MPFVTYMVMVKSRSTEQIYRLLESGIRGDNPFGVVSGRASGAKYELNQTHGDHWWITEQLKVAFYSRI